MADTQIPVTVSERTLRFARKEAERSGVSLEVWLERAVARAAFVAAADRDLDWAAAHGFVDDPSEELAIEAELAREARGRGVA